MSPSLNKKQIEEKIILQYFIENYKDFPKGKLVKSESPDFILNVSPKKSIGIELTHLHQQGVENRNSKIQINSIDREIVRFTKKLFEIKDNHKLYITFSFREYQTITKRQIPEISSEISQVIIRHLNLKDPKSPFYLKIDQNEMPKCIEAINILYHPKIKLSYWDIGKPFLMPEISEELINRIINEKNDKLPLYAKNRINIFWLIISTDFLNGASSSHIACQIERWNFSSGFHKLFLFELFAGKVYELV